MKKTNHNSSRLPDRVQTKRIAKSLNQLAMEAKPTPMSGAGRIKGDLHDKIFMYELKTKMTACKSHSIKKEWFDKIEQEALFSEKVPAVIFDFGDGDDIVSLRLRHFINLLEEFLDWKAENENS